MKIGIPKEIKNNENRVALPPAGVYELVQEGHEILVEANAGIGSTFSDEAYRAVGATIVANAADVWAADMVMKVKEPLPEEYSYLRAGLLLFTYLHVAANPELAKALMSSKVRAIGYENVQLANGALPLLSPMSEIAGRMAVQIGAQFLEKIYGGKGVLLSGVPGVRKGQVTIIGGGVAGTNAAKMALGLGAQVTILDVSIPRLQELDQLFDGQVQTLFSNRFNIEAAIQQADLVIGAVLLPGKKAPNLVTREMVKTMAEKSVIVDIAIDQGGIFETEDRVTTHDDPTYIQENVIHYAVANMPGAVPQTATLALSIATLPYAKQLAADPEKALRTNAALARGVIAFDGHFTLKEAAQDLAIDAVELSELI
ncbi:alanine dehydrogenase [Enterococcus gallinarum]|uniref:alanine dehydrogenase n=1 Tax=Enterococcus gallinarum TaxID=1353 RepID=UPI001330308C|nr:alanine dehydrogenase [Enterococcus gallinarum]MDO6298378.1 alanine dehydrogenase [Enterococcus gallinarum]MDT2697393.1 alanine dehydrogenase [Enterococcus gallinarum]